MFFLSLWYGILFLIPSEFQTYLRKENNTMNKVKYLPLIILCMLLTGCGNKNTHFEGSLPQKQPYILPKSN